jgi:hypothetical protein
MSQPFRAYQSILAVSISCFSVDSLVHAQTPASTLSIAPVSYSVDPIDTRFSRTGLIRYLQEESPQGDQLVDTPSDAPSSNTASKTDQPSSSRINQEPITLAPLGTPNTSVDGIGTGVRPEDVTIHRLPPAQPIPSGETREGMWGLQSKQWVPGGFCHQPLYFEDPMLERHGHVRFPYLQPAVSGIRFFGTVPVLPYLATLRHPLDEVHTLGAYRPGTAAPTLRYRAHYDPVALRNQFIATAGTAAAVP